MGGFGDMFGTIGGFATGEPGGFMNLLGPGGMGLTGSTSAGTAQVQLDPTTQALNTLRLNNMLNMGGSVGGFESLIPQYRQSLDLSGDTNALIASAINQASTPGLQPTDWYNQALQMTSPRSAQTELSQISGGNVQSLQNNLYSQLGVGGTELGNVLNSQMGQIGNITPQLLGAGNNYFKQILQPQIQNENSLMGLGRSGANEEAQAKGAANIALPIQQMLAQLTQQAYGQYGQGMSNLLGQAYGSYNQGLQGVMGQDYSGQSNLLNQQLQQIYGINQAYPGVSNQLQNAGLQRTLQGVNASDIQRQATSGGLQNLIQGFISGMNATPYTPAPSQKTTGTGDTGLLTSFLGGGGGQGMGAAAGKMLLA